ncbi:MAG: hypothetical protein JSW15_05865 [Deltaproteobacteria bacterium]|nr:MAG: hypothetical protein JSW15_05865 [Deltaproteobacteria bacterium]
MKRKPLILGIFLSLMVSCIGVPQLFSADMELTVKKQLNLEVSPLDISTSVDGRWIFILARGEILVYSVPAAKVVNRVPVDKAFDTLTHSPASNTLVLGSRSGKTLKIIQLELIHRIDISGLPFKGPENSLITIAVFGDYQ